MNADALKSAYEVTTSIFKQFGFSAVDYAAWSNHRTMKIYYMMMYMYMNIMVNSTYRICIGLYMYKLINCKLGRL